MTDWFEERAKYNHQTIQHLFMPRIIELVSVCQGKVATRDGLCNAVLKLHSDWIYALKQQALEILDSCEESASPRHLFLKNPLLSGIESDLKLQLSDIAHDLWLRRYDIRKHVSNCKNHLSEIQFRLEEITRIVPTDVVFIEEGLIKVHSAFKKLIDSFSKLPSSIMV